MNKIHLIRTSAFEKNSYASCIDILQESDVIVLLDDGCYNLHHPLCESALGIIGADSLYVIEHHCTARALIPRNAKTISMSELVELITQSTGTITWQ